MPSRTAGPAATSVRTAARGYLRRCLALVALDATTGESVWKYSYQAKSEQTSDVRLPGLRSTPASDGTSAACGSECARAATRSDALGSLCALSASVLSS